MPADEKDLPSPLEGRSKMSKDELVAALQHPRAISVPVH
jgi:hypothetical protein